MASAIWDSVVASATKAANQAGEATQIAATKSKLNADCYLIDRDIHARKEKFGVDMYAHLEGITGTQEFYVADDRLINIIRPTLIKAQREVAAYERKRDSMKGKVNMAEADRTGTASIFTAATIGEKIMNAAKYAAAGAKEAATKTELAMLQRQILGFKEEFGVELYPIFQSMEDNEGWLPTDRKVRCLYDAAREDIQAMEKLKEEKSEQIRKAGGVEGSGLTPPTLPAAQNVPAPMPSAVATPVPPVGNYQPSGSEQRSWASTDPTASQVVASGYGSSQSPSVQTASFTHAPGIHQTKQPSGDNFGFQPNNTMHSIMPQHSNNPAQQQPATKTEQTPSSMHDPFDGISTASNAAVTATASPFGSSYNASQVTQSNDAFFDQFSLGSSHSTAPSAQPGGFDAFSGNATQSDNNPQPGGFDPFSGNTAQNDNNPSLSEADLSLFKY